MNSGSLLTIGRLTYKVVSLEGKPLNTGDRRKVPTSAVRMPAVSPFMNWPYGRIGYDLSNTGDAGPYDDDGNDYTFTCDNICFQLKRTTSVHASNGIDNICFRLKTDK